MSESRPPTDPLAPVATPHEPERGSSFWLTRFLILRLLGFVYFFAFLSAARQVLPLLGSDGLTPASS
ncbi:MAG TPA: lipase maturation factor family protein, partial [Candidatus Eisenbacteria bacterium]